MNRVRSDMWVGAFVRRLNDRGTICVVSRKGDPIAGQIWIEFDHLDGTTTLLSPAPSAMDGDDDLHALRFQILIDRQEHAKAAARVARECDFDPDFWLITVESRELDQELSVSNAARG